MLPRKPLNITSALLQRIEEKTDQAWLCRDLLGGLCLLPRYPTSNCYEVVAFFERGRWHDGAGFEIKRGKLVGK